MEEDKEICTIIFERKKIVSDDTSTIYEYTPIEVVDGTLISVNGNKTFVSKHVKSLKGVENDNINEEIRAYEFPLMTDTSSLSDQYVYAFPIILDENNKKRIQNLKKEMSSVLEDIYNYKIIHAVNKEDNFNKVLLMWDNNKISVDPTNYYDLFNLIYGITMDRIDEVSRGYKRHDKNEETSKEENPKEVRIKENEILYSDEIYETVSKTVISQDEQIKAIAATIAENSRVKSPDLKTTLLLCGPSGVGKTEIFRSIRDNFGIPVSIEDANEYTVAGFKGKDTIEILAHLIKNSNGDLEKAKHGIIVVDEIDKKISQNADHEIYTSAVLDSLLKMIEGHVYNVPLQRGVEVQFNTSGLTFAFLGAFSGIDKYVKSKTTMGFVTQEQIQDNDDVNKLYNDTTLKKYGLKPEFIGRCDLIVALNNLAIEDLIKIIKTSNKSQLLLYKYLFNDIGIDFIYDEKTIEAIAKKANELGVGARSIKKIVKNALALARFEIFSRNNYKELIISPETIEDNHAYILR